MELQLGNSGHNPPLLVCHNGEREELFDGGPVLGFLAVFTFQTGRVQLRNGDCLVLFADGVTETMNPREKNSRKHACSSWSLRCTNLTPPLKLIAGPSL